MYMIMKYMMYYLPRSLGIQSVYMSHVVEAGRGTVGNCGTEWDRKKSNFFVVMAPTPGVKTL